MFVALGDRPGIRWLTLLATLGYNRTGNSANQLFGKRCSYSLPDGTPGRVNVTGCVMCEVFHSRTIPVSHKYVGGIVWLCIGIPGGRNKPHGISSLNHVGVIPS